MQPETINILMFHSVSDGPGPTCIAPEVFRQQLEALEDCGHRAVSWTSLLQWLRGERSLPPRSFLLTVDDGFADFAEVVLPELCQRGWPAIVFLPAGKIGQSSDWETVPRPLMNWRTAAELARQGVRFGSHGIDHLDLTAVPQSVAESEIRDSRRMIEDRIGRPVTGFAAPFGRSNAAVRELIAREYQAAVGTRLAQARPSDDVVDLPRIEMWYFRNPTRWRAYLQGKANGYLRLRQAMRGLRGLIKLA